MDMICNEEKITRALLVSVDTGGFDAEASLAELEELVKSAGAEPAFTSPDIRSAKPARMSIKKNGL